MSQDEFELEFYEDETGTAPVMDWLRKLAPYKRRAATAALEHVLARQGHGVCRSGWGKWVRGVDGIFELRIRNDYGTILRNAGLPVPMAEAEHAEQSHGDVLLRIFCHAYGKKVVLLLAGYDKGENPNPRHQTQQARRAEKRLDAPILARSATSYWSYPMATKFKDFVREVEAEARAEGPQAVAELEAFRAHYAVAEEVRELRKECKLTQKELAAASGIDQSEISRIERGQGNPTTTTLAALLAPLGARIGVVRSDDRDFAHA